MDESQATEPVLFFEPGLQESWKRLETIGFDIMRAHDDRSVEIRLPNNYRIIISADANRKVNAQMTLNGEPLALPEGQPRLPFMQLLAVAFRAGQLRAK